MRALRRTRESRAADGLRAGRPETRVPANVITGLMPSQTRDCHGTHRAERRASGRQRRGAIEGVPDQFRRPVQCDQERLQQRQHFRRRRRRQVRAPVRGSPIFERFAFDLAGRTPHRHGAGETDPSAVRMKKNTANIRWVDIGARGGAAPATFPRTIVEQCLRHVMLHYSPKPVRHVPVVSHLSPEGTDTQPLVVASRVVQGLCLPMFGGGGTAISVKTRARLAGCARLVRARLSM